MKKNRLLIICCIITGSTSFGQLGKIVKRHVENKAASEAETAIDKAIDKTVSGKSKNKTDTTSHTVSKGNGNMVSAGLPGVINFERQVIQQMSGDDGNATNTYYFTVNGDYAMAKHSEGNGQDKSMILYTKDGSMCTIDEKKKVITIMNMPRVVAEGGQMGKQVAEDIANKPLPKSSPDKMTVTKSGKTKTICGYPAYEYLVKSDGGSSSWWYAKVDFNPVKIYTMGAGTNGMTISADKAAALKNNPTAIPVLNKNFLMAEMEAAGQKGLQTISITKTGFSFSTAGYTIKDLSKKGLKEVIQEGD